MTTDKAGAAADRKVRFQSPEDILLQERLDAAQAVPNQAAIRARLRAEEDQTNAEQQRKQREETSRSAAAAVPSQPGPGLTSDRQLEGLFAYNIQELLPGGTLDYAALKARLHSHTPGVRDKPAQPATADTSATAEKQQEQRPQ